MGDTFRIVSRRPFGVAEFLLVLVSLLATAGCLEIAARRAFLLPYNPNADGWWRVSWLKRSGQFSSERAQYPIDRFHPVLGWTLRENLRDVPLLEAKVSSNSRGARGRREYSPARHGGTRVVVIGDSYSFGEGVNDAETFSAQLEQILPDSEVINLAVHGYGTDQQLLRLQIDGIPYHPDIIVFGFYDDDIGRNRLSFRDYLKPHFSVVNGRLVLDRTPLESPEAYKSHVHLRSLGYLNIFATSFGERRLAEENIERSKLILDAIAASAESSGARLVELYLPTPDQIRAGEVDHSGLFPYLCHRGTTVCLDPTAALHEIVSAVPDSSRLFRYHYAAELHQAIARELGRAIPTHVAARP
jgi:hypothetical protein